MKPIYINLDITGKLKQSNVIVISPTTPQILYYRLYSDKYEINYLQLNELRLIFEDTETSDVYTVSSSTVEIINNIKYVKIEIPINITNADNNYKVRPVVRLNNINKGLIKFDFKSRLESSTDIGNLSSMIDLINKIYSIYLDSIKRQESGAPKGVVPLGEDAKMIESFTPENILDHVNMKFEGHGLRLNKDYFIEYYDSEDKIYYKLNLLEGGKFGTLHKSSEYSYDRGLF